MLNGSAAIAARTLRLAIDEAIGEVEGFARLSAGRIHDSRRALKTARAMLQFLRPTLDRDSFTRERLALRDAGRILAAIRETRSLADAAVGLRRRDANRLPPGTPERLLGALRARLVRDRRDLARTGGVGAYLALLRASGDRLARIESLPGHPLAAAAMQRIYKVGRRAMARAQERRSVEALHEWRKHAKYLASLLAHLCDVRDAPCRRTIRHLRRLADSLGEDHDLALLDDAARSVLPRADATAFATIVAERRHVLQQRAFAAGRKAYRRRAARFVMELGLATESVANGAPNRTRSRPDHAKA